MQEAFWKALQPIVHREFHAGFGRGEGMGDDGIWITLAKRSENRLIGDFAGQPHIARRDVCRVRAHQSAAPMGWCAQKMRDAVLRKTPEIIPRRFGAVGENQRCAAEHRAQQDLQSTIATNIVEGAPYDLVGAAGAGLDGGTQASKVVNHQLGRA